MVVHGLEKYTNPLSGNYNGRMVVVIYGPEIFIIYNNNTLHKQKWSCNELKHVYSLYIFTSSSVSLLQVCVCFRRVSRQWYGEVVTCSDLWLPM